MEPKFDRVPLETLPAESQPTAAPANSSTSVPTENSPDLEKQVIAALQSCYDPEIPVNIYELGLIYKVDVDAAGAVAVRMTLTSPACPAAGSLPPEIQRKIQAIPGVTTVKVDVVWEPPWEQSMMSEAAQVQLGLM